ncbi:MAG: TIR domain-containing protein [Anaerolineales bacterium]
MALLHRHNGLQLLHELDAHRHAICALTWQMHPKKLLSAGTDGTIHEWDVERGIAERHIQAGNAPWRTLIRSAEGKQAVVAHHQQPALYILDLQSGMSVMKLASHFSPVNAMGLAADGERFVSASEDGTLKIWSLVTGMDIRTLQRHSGSVRTLAISPHNNLILSGGDDQFVYVWDMHEGHLLHTLPAHHGPVNALATSPDGTLFASGSDDHTVRVWSISDGQVRHILEAHSAPIRNLDFSADGGLLASQSTDGELVLWRCDSWEPAGHHTPASLPPGPLAFHPTAPVLATSAGEPGQITIWELDYHHLFAHRPAQTSHRYTTVKVALVGDSGVGKSALGHRIAYGQFQPTISTHGQQYWVVDRLGSTAPDGTERQIVLWDFAGQADYRLVHTLFLGDIDIALLLFDAAERDDFLRGVEYWVEQLRQRSGSRAIKMILVGGRLDRGEPWLTDNELNEFCRYHDIEGGYIGTSALSGRGMDELTQRLHSLIDWDSMTTTVTTGTFQRIKDFVLNLQNDPLWQRNNRVLMTHAELSERLQALWRDFAFDMQELRAAVQHLENHGYVKRIRDTDLQETILLRPELLIKLASSFVLHARAKGRGLGAIEEKRLFAEEYDFPELADLAPDERKTLITATTRLLIERHICLRGHSDDRPLLIFPTLIHQKRPFMKDLVLVDDVTYRVSGSIEYLYALLVVQISYASKFTRTHFWQSQAQFQMGLGEVCGFRIEALDGHQADLVIYCAADASDYTRHEFKELFERTLRGTNAPYSRYPRAFCPTCETYQPRQVIIDRLMNHHAHLHCIHCGHHIDLSELDTIEHLTPQNNALLRREQERTRMKTAFEVALVHIRSKITAEAPSVFISYAWGNHNHELWVARLAEHLATAGLKVIWDGWHNTQIGSSLSRFISRLEQDDFIIVVGSPAYRQKYENQDSERGSVVAAEFDLITLRLLDTERAKSTVLPVLVEGDESDAFPPLLRGRIFADFREERFYFVELFKLVLTLYHLSPGDPVIGDLQKFMLGNME